MQLAISPAVRAAMHDQQPVVALETTVLTHGLPGPHNVEVAFAMEAAIREAGACPATLGVVGGQIVVGMSAQQIERFGTAERGAVRKCSRRDLAAVVAGRQDGSLTVAGTVVVADAAEIPIMATGGIGGVHRGQPFDVSADLVELGRNAVACVCSGPKSILDLKKTLEVLETQGVTLVGLGTRNLPAFFARDSGLPLPHEAGTCDAAADLLRAWRDLDTGAGLLLAVPVPAEDGLDADVAEDAIDEAVREAAARGIEGNAVTPFVLERVRELTDGRSLVANSSLLVNNARIAATLAVKAGFGRRHPALSGGR